MRPLLSPIFSPLSALYGGLTRLRLTLYQRRVLTSYKIDAPVISVGNITTGGTGKTPIVEWLAHTLANEGYKICILTRGYGRVSPKSRVIVSDGEQILADAREGGDEPYLLANRLKGKAAVISDANRVEAAEWAIKNLQSPLFILDDAYQHLKIARDLNILTIDGTNPWGGGKLLPVGRLREPLTAISRADCIIITRAEQIERADQIYNRIREFNKVSPIYLSKTSIKRIWPFNHTQKLLPEKIGAFCGIGNPAAFFKQIANNRYSLVYRKSFLDHYIYKQKDIDILVQEAKEHGAEALLTTAKDAVKLGSFEFKLPCYVVETAVEIDQEAEMIELIKECLNLTVKGK
jgi:tetraacyldisaccharide 4'-kinase